ncbi:MAG: translation initiation factor eIF-1A [Thermoprotei archaeon]|nr:MAG: translation initiation factor eIF-1A [Desulfurococcales archaeon ex4484_217_2]RLG73691.1 MAG: translation initiation factor eIF-1A [Thermoprotei archaeon]
MPKKKIREEKPKEPPVPGEGETIGVVEKLLGHEKAKVKCFDGKTRLCRIPGRMKKRVWIKEGDYVLVSIWDFQPEKRGDIIYRYSRDEIRKLAAKGIIVVEELVEE